MGGIERELKRIADVLERWEGRPSSSPLVRKAGVRKSGLIEYGNEESVWQREQFEDVVRERGLGRAEEIAAVDEMMEDFRKNSEGV